MNQKTKKQTAFLDDLAEAFNRHSVPYEERLELMTEFVVEFANAIMTPREKFLKMVKSKWDSFDDSFDPLDSQIIDDE